MNFHPAPLEGQGGEPLSEIAGFLVPVKVRGAMDDPKISLDIKKVLAQTALGEKQKALEAKLDERKDELKQKQDEKKEELKQKAGADPKYASMNEKWKKLKADREEVLNSQTEAKKAANRIDGLIGTFGLKGR